MKVCIYHSAPACWLAWIYSLLNVGSPAPPLVALVGLPGILIGEQVIPVGKQIMTGAPISSA